MLCGVMLGSHAVYCWGPGVVCHAAGPLLTWWEEPHCYVVLLDLAAGPYCCDMLLCHASELPGIC